MRVKILIVAGLFLVFLAQGQAPYLTVAVPPQDITTLWNNPLYANWDRGELYLIYGASVTVVKKADGSTSATIPFPTGSNGTSCLSPSGQIGTMVTKTSGGNITTYIQIVDPVSGSSKQLATKQFLGGMTCTFSPIDGLLYLPSNYTGSTWNKIISVDPATMQIVKGWSMGINEYAVDVLATGNGVYVGQSGGIDGTGGLVKIDPGGNYQLIHPNLGGSGMYAPPNGQLCVSGYFYATDDTLTPVECSGIGIAWPTNDPYFVYYINPDGIYWADYIHHPIENILPYPGQKVYGIVSHELPDGTDQIIAWREGYLDFYKVTPPSITTQIVNGASFEAGPVAPNEWITLSGRSLAPQPTVPDPKTQTKDAPFPIQLGGVQVLLQVPGLGDSFLPMAYVGPDQVNVLTPKDLPSGVTATFKVHTQMSPAPTAGPKQNWQPELYLSASTAPAAPALFMAANARPWVVHADGHIDTTAAAGEIVSFYGNALGPVAPGAYGLMWNVPLPSFTVNGIPANVPLCGLQPDFFGLYQCNVQIPAGIPDGDQTLEIKVGLATSRMRIRIQTQ